MTTFELYWGLSEDFFVGMSGGVIDLVEAVYNHADEHYGEGGWDVLVETHDPADIAERLHEGMTSSEAIDAFRDSVSVWADRQADARNSAF